MYEPKNNVLASCVTILMVMGVFISVLIIIGAGMLIFHLATGGL
jgi:hypothetical protein